MKSKKYHEPSWLDRWVMYGNAWDYRYYIVAAVIGFMVLRFLLPSLVRSAVYTPDEKQTQSSNE